MFEDMTYKTILDDMLRKVSSDVDKREGSVIYDALAPCAYKLAETYYNMNHFLYLVSGSTAVGEYLDRVVADYGITRKKATYAERKVKTTGAVNIGTRWGISNVVYKITALLSNSESAYTYSALCETAGMSGNAYYGTLESIDNVGDITASLTDVIAAGTEEETDDALRARFYEQVRTPGTSGNAGDYKKWAMEVPGVGAAKVFPLWSGSGTVQVIIVDSDKLPAGEAMVNEVAEYIESVRPVGAAVAVASAVGKAIRIDVSVSLASGYTLQTVQDGFARVFSNYLADIAFDTTYVSHGRIGTLLLSVPGVIDYSGLLLNGTAANISLADKEIPITGEVILEVN